MGATAPSATCCNQECYFYFYRSFIPLQGGEYLLPKLFHWKKRPGFCRNLNVIECAWLKLLIFSGLFAAQQLLNEEDECCEPVEESTVLWGLYSHSYLLCILPHCTIQDLCSVFLLTWCSGLFTSHFSCPKLDILASSSRTVSWIL